MTKYICIIFAVEILEENPETLIWA